MTEVDTLINEPSEAEKRIKQLSDKVKSTAEERDAEAQKTSAAEARAVEAEKKAQFADQFSDIVANNPAAKDFKADIQAKVMAGYTPEDAAYAVLGKAGKLGTIESNNDQVAGGSATTNAAPQVKTATDMSQTERRAALEAALGIS